MKKTVVFLILIAAVALGLFVSGAVGCGSSSEKPDKSEPQSSAEAEQRLLDFADVSKLMVDDKGNYLAAKEIVSQLKGNLGTDAAVGNPDDVSGEMSANPDTIIIFLAEGKALEAGLVEKGTRAGYYLKIEDGESSIEEVEVG